MAGMTSSLQRAPEFSDGLKTWGRRVRREDQIVLELRKGPITASKQI
jgi:hypothetical protein